MKKNIVLYLAVVFALVLQFNIDIFAADFTIGNEDFTEASQSSLSNGYFPTNYNINDIPQASKDNSGHYTKGSIVMYNEQYDNYYICGNQFNSNEFNARLCTYMFVIMDDSAIAPVYYLAWSNEVNAPYDKICGLALYGKDDPYNLWRGYLLGQNNASSNNLYKVTSDYYGNANTFVSTNLPIFRRTDSASIEQYINNGSIDGATNKNEIEPPKVIPQPYFDKENGLDAASKRQRLSSGFSNSLIYKWFPGTNSNYNYENMGYEGTLTVTIDYFYNSVLTTQTFTEDILFTQYDGDNPYYVFNSDKLNKKIFTLWGYDFFGSLGGRIVKAVYEIRNVDIADHSNKSAKVYYSYNFIDQTSGTNNDNNNNNDSTEESTENITYNPNENYGGNGEPSNSSSSSSATANGVVVNVTQNNNNNKSSVWDTLINALSALATVFSNKIGGVFDSIADFFGHLSNITDSTGILSKLIENLSTYLVGTNSGSGSGNGSGNGSSGGLSGLAGTIESITGSINTLISGVLTPFTNAVTSLMSSVTDLLNASSTLGQYITSGFGLLGDNGYISMFAAFFQFVPTEIWSIIKLAVGSSASVLLSGSVVKLLRRY